MRSKNINGNSLKAKASEAKKRIASGKWGMIEAGVTSYDRELYLLLKKYVFNNIGQIHLPYTDFDTFFDSVYDLLKDDVEHLNPLKVLVNEKYKDSLTPDNQQRYVLFLSKKYIYIKTNYQRIKANLDERICLEQLTDENKDNRVAVNNIDSAEDNNDDSTENE